MSTENDWQFHFFSTLKRIYECDREDDNRGQDKDYDVVVLIFVSCTSSSSPPPMLCVYRNDW